MKIQIASDLHLEWYRNTKSNDTLFKTIVDPSTDADLLILAGDIGYPEDTITKDFIHWCCNTWPEVVWVYGNHEYYNTKESYNWRRSKHTYTMAEKEGEAPIVENLHILNSSEFVYDGIPILGTTLWTDVKASEANALQNAMSDFTYIKQNDGYPLTVSEWTSRHAVEREWLQVNLDKIALEGRKAIVVTHHLPTYEMILPQYKGYPNNCGFAAHADDLVKHPGVALWVCGHSHGQRILELEGRKVILNARGYPGENSTSSYNPRLVVDLDPSLCGASFEVLPVQEESQE
jgi:predicted phosphodiesterase